MFSSKHAIWKFANAAGELDDWLPYAADLIKGWSTQEPSEVRFLDTFEIALASFLLEDDLLPRPARVAFSRLMLEAVNELREKKIRVKSLSLNTSPPKPGRKNNRTENAHRLWEVAQLIQEGKTASEAYAEVGAKHFKAPDTIRREYERAAKKRKKRRMTGENET